MPDLTERGVQINIALDGMARDAYEILAEMSGGTPEQIVTEALLNTAEFRIYEAEDRDIFVGKKKGKRHKKTDQRLKGLTRIEMYKTPLKPRSNVIFLQRKLK